MSKSRYFGFLLSMNKVRYFVLLLPMTTSTVLNFSMHTFIILFNINPSILLDILCFHDYLPDTIMELLQFNTCIYIYRPIFFFNFLEHYFFSGILYITFTTCPCSSYIINFFESIFFEGLNKWLMYRETTRHLSLNVTIFKVSLLHNFSFRCICYLRLISFIIKDYLDRWYAFLHNISEFKN